MTSTSRSERKGLRPTVSFCFKTEPITDLTRNIAGSLMAAAILLLPAASGAELHDRGNGLIYDDVLDITWLSDAGPAPAMTWTDALAFADGFVHGGFDDWRLPTTLQPDSTCSSQTGGFSAGTGCMGSEMGFMFYVNLSGTALQPIETSGDPDLALFTNLDNTNWSSDEVNASQAWLFHFSSGAQGFNPKTQLFVPWPVRDGDSVSSVPSVGAYGRTLLVGLLGAAAVLGLKRKSEGELRVLSWKR